MYVIKNDNNKFIGADSWNKPTIVSSEVIATKYKTPQKALNAIKNLPFLMAKNNWMVYDENKKQYYDANSKSKSAATKTETAQKESLPTKSVNETLHEKKQEVKFEPGPKIEPNIKVSKKPTSNRINCCSLPEDFDIQKFLNEVAPVFANLKSFESKKISEEERINDELLDLRHYLRDNIGKINAIQMQRLGYYCQQLEKEREIAKKSHQVADLVLKNISMITHKNFVDSINIVFEAAYKPRVLTYEMISEISNTPRGTSKPKKSA